MEKENDRFLGGILGLVVGDALGVPREELEEHPVYDMEEYGTYSLPKGSWSDDSSMVLATLDSLRHGFDLDDMMKKFAIWMTQGVYTPFGKAFDVGTGTLQERLQKGIQLGFEFYSVKGFDPMELQQYQRIRELESFRKLEQKDIESHGYVVVTLEAALWCLLNTTSYKECVLKAVNLGDDTDTVAAVAGGLAGLYYGVKSIPEDWLEILQRRKWIERLCQEFSDSFR